AFLPFLASTFRGAGERLLFTLVKRLLIFPSMAENEPAITPARAPVCEAFISIIYRQVKKIPVLSGALIGGLSPRETSAVLLKSQSQAHIASSEVHRQLFGGVSSMISSFVVKSRL